jgi:hypothetical protein
VDLDDLRRARLNSNISKDRHEELAKCLELLRGIPDLADLQPPGPAEADVIVEAVRGKVPGFL